MDPRPLASVPQPDRAAVLATGPAHLPYDTYREIPSACLGRSPVSVDEVAAREPLSRAYNPERGGRYRYAPQEFQRVLI